MKRTTLSKRLAITMIASGLGLIGLPTLATQATASTIPDAGAYEGETTTGAACGTDGSGTWASLTLPPDAGEATISENGFNLTVETTGTTPAGVRVIALQNPVDSVAFSQVVLRADNGSARLFMMPTTALSTAGALVPEAPGTTTTGIALCTQAIEPSAESAADDVTDSVTEAGVAASAAAAPLASLTITNTNTFDFNYFTLWNPTSFEIAVKNDGPNPAIGVKVTIPAVPGFVPRPVEGSPCNATLTECNLGDMAVGETRTFTVTYGVPGDYLTPTSVNHQATVSSTSDPTDSTATETIAFAALKTETVADDIPSDLVAGEPISFIITTTNIGGHPVSGVRVILDDPDAALVGCSLAGELDDVEPTGYELAPGEALTCIAARTVRVNDRYEGGIEFTATATSHQAKSTISTAKVELSLPDQDDFGFLHLKKRSLEPFGYITLGGTTGFEIEVINWGPSTATDVVVTDAIPTGLIPVPDQDGPCSADFTVCELGDLEPNESVTFQVWYVVPNEYAGPTTITNTARATTPNDDTPEEASATVQLAALSVTKTVANQPAAGFRAGDTVTFDIAVTNDGDFPLSGVFATDTVPGVTIVTCAVGTATQAAVDPSGYKVPADGRLLCKANYTVTLEDMNRGSFANSATGDSDQTAPSFSDITVRLPQTPDLAITKTATSTGPYSVGSVVAFEITVANTGTVTVSDIRLTEQADATLVSCVPPSSLEPGKSFKCNATHTATAEDFKATKYTNVASVTGIGANKAAVAKSATATIQLPEADLQVIKTAVGQPIAGGTATFSIVIKNNGPGAATGVTVTDDALFGFRPTGATGTGWTCSLATGAPICTTTTVLAAGDSLPPITVIGPITALPGGTVQNRSSVSAVTADPNITNNTSTTSFTLPGVLAENELPPTGAAPQMLLIFGAVLTLAGALVLMLSNASRRPAIR